MVSTNDRIDLLDKLGNYMLSQDDEWEEAKHRALNYNAWFTMSNINTAVNNIVENYLQKDLLANWIVAYPLPATSKKAGIVMAGNIPLVGFHDFLCGFVMGHELYMKLSSKDDALPRHLINKLIEWYPPLAQQLYITDTLKGCDAYIATGSNNTARYFEQYFGKYPNIIRRNRTSVAVLEGNETDEEMNGLAEDIFIYYGLGCRNVTKVYLPAGYNPVRLLESFSDYSNVIHHHKYKNNYDYHLAVYMLNRVQYLCNDFLILVENKEPFSAVSVLHYEFYTNKDELLKTLQKDDNIQCIVSRNNISFGMAQSPGLSDYADGVDTMMFLSTL